MSDLQMVRFVLRLPGGLYQNLKTLAQANGLSLNQYVLFVLLNHVAPGSIIRHSEEDVVQQEARFAVRLAALPQPSPDQLADFIAERLAGDRETAPTESR